MSLCDIVKRAFAGIGLLLAVDQAYIGTALADVSSSSGPLASSNDSATPGKRIASRKRPISYRSPFGGTKAPEPHQCWQGTPQNKEAGIMEICPFDLYTALRRGGRKHKALDLHGQVGTPLYAIAPGTVVGVGHYETKDGKRVRMPNWRRTGNAVKVLMPNGLIYTYAHLDRTNVRLGQRIGYRSMIGELGCSGNATCKYNSDNNPHVHLAIERNKTRVDPLGYLTFLRQ